MDHTVPHPELYRVPLQTEDFNGMPYRRLGRSGLRVSAIGLGTWKFGLPETGDNARVDERTAFAIFDRAVELGVTFWDTANRYNDASGNSERLIGRWLRVHPDQRRDVVIATKVFGGMDGRTPNHCRLSRANILDSVYACLARLQTDHIDLLYFHRYDPVTPAEESLAAVEDLVSRDLVRYFGGGNISVSGLQRYAQAAPSVRSQVVAVQNSFDILTGERAAEQRGVLDYCAQHGISYVAWSPLARGLLTDRYLDSSQVGAGDRLFDEGTFERDAQAAVMAKVRRLAGVAHAAGLALNQLALAYMLALPGMGPVIPGASTVAQLESNARAGTVMLTAEQIAQIRSILES
jgi:aryl-alcohol dehydrogenase-like predicted oxidoreductase